MSTSSGQLPSRFSPTALETFSTCPKRFEFRYVTKEMVEEGASPHLVLGNAVHGALAILYRLPLEQRGEDAAHRALRHSWAQIADRQEAFFGDEDEADWGNKALEALSRYCQSYELGIRPIGVEEWVSTKLPNGVSVFGKADRIDRARGLDAGIEVVDYKTGRCRIEDDELNEVLAARFYALAAGRTLHQPVVKVRFVYLLEDVECTWRPENEDLAEVEQELVDLTGEIASTEEFAPNPACGLCRWCAYRSICPATDDKDLSELEAPAELAF